MRRWRLAFLALALAANAAAEPVATFSQLPVGEGVPAGWREVRLGALKAPQYARVADEGGTVLRVRSEGAAGSLARAVSLDPRERSRLAWRWKVDRVVDKADLEQKAGDDFAARLYVFFEVPDSSWPFFVRAKLKIARLLYGDDVPTAAICYVWDNRHAPGTIRPSAYTSIVSMVVLQSGAGGAGKWARESRDLDADFRAAFPELAARATPRVTGIALGNDTDQTQESVTAWFGDVAWERAP